MSEKFEKVYQNWKEVVQCSGDCSGGGDICICTFEFECARCGNTATVYGEDMEQTNDFGGLCFTCIAKEHFA